ncbi:DUF799 domain-containing protein [Campylobacter sp.]|uniref:DUF799 domain-containing protein n=1 Tax=Campylobacter sp. TaxID=205 RepID=UPI00270A332A|nr:DUF799 family lipoprotein [Campylobacter sp.]
MLNNIKSYLLLALIALFFSACVSEPAPRHDYSAFLQSNPRSILVPMPINDSADIKASSVVLAHAVPPLTEAGYYVFPVGLVNDTFKFNGFSEAHEIHQIPLAKLKQIFNADSVLYLHVKEYGSSYVILDSVSRVSVEARLVDINSGQVIWQNSATASNSSQGGGDLVSMLINAAVKQVADTLSDVSYDLAIKADRKLFTMGCDGCLLYGPYSPKYRQF